MSAYSDYKSGAISEEEYKQISQREARMDAIRREAAFIDQHIYGRSMDRDYYYDPREEG